MRVKQNQNSAASVSKQVLRNSVPAIAAMIMVLIYNLADTFFIGQTNDDLQVAAVSVATPVFLIFMALGTLFGMGGTSVISRALGEGRGDYAKKVSSFCMWACVAVGIVFTILFWILMDRMLLWIGASADTMEYARRYLEIVSLCGPFVLIGNCFSNVIRAEGRPAVAMMGMLIGNLVNVALDPIMILWLNWEIAGAAIATVIGNIAAALYYLIYFWRGKSTLSIRPRDFTIREKVCSGVLAIGIPASLGSLLMSVSQVVVNGLMAGYGDLAVAAIGVSMKVTMIIAMFALGLGQGVQPLLGYCVGAKDWQRFRAVMRFSLWFALGLGVTLTALSYLFAEPLVGAFLTDPAAMEYGVAFSKILLTTGAAFGVLYVLINALQAMGAALPSLIISICRQGLIYVPALFALHFLFGRDGLVWAQPLADLLSLLLAALLYQITLRKWISGSSSR